MKADTIPRVLHVFTILNRGGAETMIMNYYRNIDRTKLQFDFLVHRPERGVYEDEIEELGGNIYRMPPINPLFPNAYYKELNEFFNKHPYYKIVHSHINTFSLFPLKVAQLKGITTRIAHAHTTTELISFIGIVSNPMSALKIAIKNNQKRKSKKHASHLFACGVKAGKWLFGDSSDFIVINNAIDTEKFVFNKDLSNSLKLEYGLNNKTIGHIGNFSYPKNYPFILAVFSEIYKIDPEFKLVLLGDGHKRTEIEIKAKELGVYDNIVFTGVKSNINELLNMIDAFLFPSIYEGLPVTLVEAQASGLKVFASDTITKEVALTDDITYMSLKEPAKAWAEKIVASLPYNRKNNYEIIKAKGYDIKENARQLQNFYLDQINAL